jgi:hypothetical protein
MPLRLHGFASSNLEGVLPNIKLGVRNEFPKESCGNHLNPSSLFISPIVSEAFVQNAASKQRRDGPEVAQEQQEHLSLRPRPPRRSVPQPHCFGSSIWSCGAPKR